jgi:ferredoxin/flavodoxin---NADP+ reductase
MSDTDAMNDLGTPANPLRVAIVGSGPAGFYATEALLGSQHAVSVDMFERLAAPFGLVRSGVAPDHPKLKQAIQVYEQIASSPGFSFFGNVTVGRDISVSELQSRYHALLLACGAQTDRALDVPGEHLPGSHAATEFVGWYNGHPDYRDVGFDLSRDTAVVIGQGNVAMDVCRILGKTADELRHTDIAAHALEVLAESKVRDIYLVGRRGPAQVKFTHSELRELGELADCDPVIDPRDLVLNRASQQELADRSNRAAMKSYEVLREFAARPAPTRRRRCHIVFLKSPLELVGADRLQRVLLMRNRLTGEPGHQIAEPTGEIEQIPCGLLFRSVGYRGVAIGGVPFDNRRGVIPNRDGRVVDGSTISRGLYVAGWIKRGPSGIIGTNREDSVLTVNAIFADLRSLDASPKHATDRVGVLLQHRGVRVVSYADWQTICAAEVERGKAAGKPREKFTRLEEMLDAVFGHEDQGEKS